MSAQSGRMGEERRGTEEGEEGPAWVASRVVRCCVASTLIRRRLGMQEVTTLPVSRLHCCAAWLQGVGGGRTLSRPLFSCIDRATWFRESRGGVALHGRSRKVQRGGPAAAAPSSLGHGVGRIIRAGSKQAQQWVAWVSPQFSCWERRCWATASELHQFRLSGKRRIALAFAFQPGWLRQRIVDPALGLQGSQSAPTATFLRCAHANQVSTAGLPPPETGAWRTPAQASSNLCTQWALMRNSAFSNVQDARFGNKETATEKAERETRLHKQLGSRPARVTNTANCGLAPCLCRCIEGKLPVFPRTPSPAWRALSPSPPHQAWHIASQVKGPSAGLLIWRRWQHAARSCSLAVLWRAPGALAAGRRPSAPLPAPVPWQQGPWWPRRQQPLAGARQWSSRPQVGPRPHNALRLPAQLPLDGPSARCCGGGRLGRRAVALHSRQAAALLPTPCVRLAFPCLQQQQQPPRSRRSASS